MWLDPRDALNLDQNPVDFREREKEREGDEWMRTNITVQYFNLMDIK